MRPQQMPEFEAPPSTDSSLHGDDAAERSSGDDDAVVADDAADYATSAVAAVGGPDAAVERGVAAGGWEDRFGGVAAAENVVGGSQLCLSACRVGGRVGGVVLAERDGPRCC